MQQTEDFDLVMMVRELAVLLQPQARTQRVQIELAQVAFCDTGPGIPSALLDQVDRIYFTTKSSGTGMGLFVTLLMVEARGGTLEVANQPGSGACITLALPLANAVRGRAN